MKIIDQLKKVNLIQFVPAIFVISLVGNSVFGYTAPKSEKSKNNSENQVEAATTQAKKKTKKANAGDIDLSKIKDGTYEGQANGYRGLVKVSVTVKDHKITAIKVLSNSDDAAFFNRASAGVIKNILAKQSLKVDVVSGATYSSNGIIKAVKNALTGEEDKSSAKAGGSSAKSAGSVGTADESGTYKDGTFIGTASGYHGTVKVSVTIKKNKIKSIKILENHDDAAYFNRAKGILLPLMVKKQSTNVDAVSGATFSSNGINIPNAKANAGILQRVRIIAKTAPMPYNNQGAPTPLINGSITAAIAFACGAANAPLVNPYVLFRIIITPPTVAADTIVPKNFQVSCLAGVLPSQ